MYDIISIGSATRDVLIESDQGASFPLGAKIEIKKMIVTTGGGGTNYAVAFARQGLKTACIGVIGSDANGRDVLTDLEADGVDVSMFEKHHDDDLTAYSVILVHPNAERTILSYKGEGQHFNAAELDFSKLQTRWLFLDSLGGHYDLFEKLVHHAVKNNIKIACNPGGKELEHGLEKLKPLLAHIDILLLNRDEGNRLLNSNSEILNSKQISMELQKITNGIVSVSDGPKGVSVIDDKEKTYTAGIPDSPVVERTGAGDAYGSGFVSEYIRSGDIIKAIQFGTANASSVVTQFGAKAGILKSGPDASVGVNWGPWPLVEVVKSP